MTRVATLSLSVLLISLVGLLGCTPEGKNTSASARKDRSLEAKCVRLEGDFRQACEARDKYRKELTSAELQRDGLSLQLARLKKDLGGLEVKFTNSTSEVEQLTAERDDFAMRLVAAVKHRERVENELTTARNAGDQWRTERDTFAEHINRLTKELSDQKEANLVRSKQLDDAKADAEALKEQFDTFRQMLRTQIDQAEAAINLNDGDRPQQPVMIPIADL